MYVDCYYVVLNNNIHERPICNVRAQTRWLAVPPCYTRHHRFHRTSTSSEECCGSVMISEMFVYLNHLVDECSFGHLLTEWADVMSSYVLWGLDLSLSGSLSFSASFVRCRSPLQLRCTSTPLLSLLLLLLPHVCRMLHLLLHYPYSN